MDDKIFDGLPILRRLACVSVAKLLDSQRLKLLDALSAALHLVEADFVAGLSCGLPVLSSHLFDLLFMVFLSFEELLLEKTFRVLLALPLTFEHDLKGTLMGILPHHTLQFESVGIQLHHFVS